MATAAAVLKTAASEIGYKEKYKNLVKFWLVLKAIWNGNPWCATFVQWVLKVNGMWYDAALPYYVPSFVAKAKADGTWIPKGGDRVPKPGDLQVMGYTRFAHIGFLERRLGGGLYQSIEGNTSSGNAGSQNNGDGVYRRIRSSAWIRGWISMPYDPPAPKPVAKPVAKPKAVKVPVFPGEVSKGDSGRAVRLFQKRLRDRGWKDSKGRPLAVDGKFGPETERAVRLFQKDKHLKVDGIAGRHTWTALWTKKIT